MTYFTEEYLDGLYDEGYKARVEHGATVCPYQDPVAAEAWWNGYDRAVCEEGGDDDVGDDDGYDCYAEADFAWVHDL